MTSPRNIDTNMNFLRWVVYAVVATALAGLAADYLGRGWWFCFALYWLLLGARVFGQWEVKREIRRTLAAFPPLPPRTTPPRPAPPGSVPPGSRWVQ